MIKISNPGSVVYPEKFKAGDMVKALKFVQFCDGSSHTVGQVLIVTENNVSFYNIFHEDYELVGE